MRRLAILLVLLPLLAVPARAETGTFLHVSDIHFDPFDPPDLPRSLVEADLRDWPSILAALPDQALSGYGRDTNHALLAAALAEIGKAGADADFAIVTGDLLAHRFEERSSALLGAPARSEAVNAFAVRTTIFVAEAIAAALPGKPVFLSLGNNDSDCGDYRIEPRGNYLAQTRDTVRRLAGPERLEADFDETYRLGGYYAARHPTAANALVLVLNDVLWSMEYLNACGDTGNAAGDEMLRWLGERLNGLRRFGGKAWLARHIPLGVDAYATTNANVASCPAKVRPFLKEPYASALLRLLEDYSDVIQASFSGHIHFDDYRLVSSADGRPVGVEKIAPGISPIFGQNPGFHVFSYDRASGEVTDFSTLWLANLAAAAGPAIVDWRTEYTFTQAYGEPRYSPSAVKSVLDRIRSPGPARDTYDGLYDVSRGDFDPVSFPAHSCAIAYPDVQGFTRCFCGR